MTPSTMRRTQREIHPRSAKPKIKAEKGPRCGTTGHVEEPNSPASNDLAETRDLSRPKGIETAAWLLPPLTDVLADNRKRRERIAERRRKRSAK